MLNLSLLGPFELTVDERPLTQLSAQKVQALLIYLAVEARQTHRREALMALLWPDYPQKSAQQSLRQAVYLLRQAIEAENPGAPLILTERLTLALNPDAALMVDVDQFEELSGIGRSPQEWKQAVELYRGHFLADFYLPDSEPFEEWAASKRAFYQRRMQELLQRLVKHYLEIGDDLAAETAARRQLALDNLQEAAHRQLMEIMARNGRRQEALTHFQSLQKLLQDELAIEPSRETLALIKTIRADLFDRPVMPTRQFTPQDKGPPPKHNLPQRLTSFIGRQKEITAVTNLISQNRFVMLTGVGGIGKTNLSLQVGRTLLESFPDGVWLVELAPLADPALIPQTAATTLGLPDSPNQPALQTLLNYLHQKSCLLLLDNCEHLINATARFVQTLLQSCPDLKILASSREALGIPGEISFSVPPLSFPDAIQNPSLEEWQQYDAIGLFVERATAVLPHFQVTAENIKPLIQICQRLDGIPLALELAAARVKMLTTTQIAGRLDNRFRLLTGGNRTALPRHQTLRALIDWSWDLLSAADQILLQRLSVFAGSMNLEAIEAVCSGDGLDVYDILDVLSELVNKSLVMARREQGKETRYYLLETIRQYAHERLVTAGQRTLSCQHHLDYFLQLGEQAEQALVGPDQVAWMNRLEKEWDNIRSALKWANETNPEKGLRLIVSLEKFWRWRGNSSEGEVWLAQLLAHSENIEPTVRASALNVQGFFVLDLFDFDRADQLLNDSLSLYQSLEDHRGIALCYLRMALSDERRKKLHPTQERLLKSLDLFRRIEDKLGIADTLSTMGSFAGNVSNNYEEAAIYLKESLYLYRELSHLAGIAIVLELLGWFAMRQGDYESARLWLEESRTYAELVGGNLGLFTHLGELYFRLEEYEKSQTYLEKSIFYSKQMGNFNLLHWAEVFLGYCFLRKGELAQAQAIFIESQQQFKDGNLTIGVVFATEGLAMLAVRRQQPKRAVRLFAWADVTRQAIQDIRPPNEQADVDRHIAIIRDTVDEETYDNLYAYGQHMTMDEAIAYVIEDKSYR